MKTILILCLFFTAVSCTKSKKEEGQQSQNTKAAAWKPTDVKEELGWHLYFDKRLSADNTISCNSCHDVTNQNNGTDSLPVSVGINGQKGGRNAPTVWNAKFLSAQFWDARAKDLADQAKGPITNPIEMGMKNHDEAIAKVKDVKGYQELFKKAYPDQEDPLNIDNLAAAISAFEHTLVVIDTPFDKKTMSDAAKKGYEKFQKTGCISCHSGDHFAGPALPIGQGFLMKFPTFPDKEIEAKYGFTKDPGRFEVTKKEQDKNMWRVPSLRNVAKTGPYFHNGKVDSLEEAVKIMAKLQLNNNLSDEDANSIVAFLNALTGSFPVINEPKPL